MRGRGGGGQSLWCSYPLVGGPTSGSGYIADIDLANNVSETLL